MRCIFYSSSNFKTKETTLITRTFHPTVSLRASSNYVKLFVQPIKRGHFTRNLRCTLWQTTLAKSDKVIYPYWRWRFPLVCPLSLETLNTSQLFPSTSIPIRDIKSCTIRRQAHITYYWIHPFKLSEEFCISSLHHSSIFFDCLYLSYTYIASSFLPHNN